VLGFGQPMQSKARLKHHLDGACTERSSECFSKHEHVHPRNLVQLVEVNLLSILTFRVRSDKCDADSDSKLDTAWLHALCSISLVTLPYAQCA
jgi:hypothetical protein